MTIENNEAVEEFDGEYPRIVTDAPVDLDKAKDLLFATQKQWGYSPEQPSDSMSHQEDDGLWYLENINGVLGIVGPCK